MCVHSIFKERNEFGGHQYLFRALRRHPKKLFEYLRLSIDTFDYILSKVHDSLEKPHPWWRTEEEYCQTLANASGYKLPYFSIDNARVIYTKRSKFVKNEYARYTAVYISLGCVLYIRCALSIEKYGSLFPALPLRSVCLAPPIAAACVFWLVCLHVFESQAAGRSAPL